MNITLPASVLTYELRGEAGPALDCLLACLIGAGVTVSPIEPTTRYRLTGDRTLLDAFGPEVARIGEWWRLAIEEPPAGAVQLSADVAPAAPWRRTTYVHGIADAYSHVRAAIDAGLQVRAGGVNRWAVTGTTAAQLAWLARVQGVSADEVLQAWRLTPEAAAAEDQGHTTTVAVTVPVTVTLPARKTVTNVERNADGDIVRAVAVESDV
jgi:hypothetical protein